MRNFLTQASGPLFDSERETGGGGTAVETDPGLPHEHDNEDDDEPGGEKDDDPPEVKTLKTQLAEERAARLRAQDDAQFWSRQAKAGNRQQPQAETVVEEDDEVDDPEPAKKKLTGEQVLNLLAEEGEDGLLRILKERGDVVSRKEMTAAVARARTEATEEFQRANQDDRFEQKLGKEFPDLMRESINVEKGQASTNPHYLRTAEIYREMVAEDPSMRGTNGALLFAARQARAELKGSSARTTGTRGRQQGDDDDATPHTPSKGKQRRDRIERQAPPRSQNRGDDSESDDGDGLTDAALDIGRRLGVSQKDLAKHAKGGGARRR